MAVRSGADAIVVSNHGGRQLDGAASSISMLADIVQAVQAESGTHATSCEIFLDSGVRSGQDALKAIALGAKATMIGRAFLYGLGAYGEDGVRRALEIIYNEMDISMAFGGYTNIQQVSKDILIKGTYEDLLTRPFIVRERS
jgi:L-lactate dehydrogenase (cytochrome)